MPSVDEALIDSVDVLRRELARRGIRLRITSGYRSLREQRSLFERRGPRLAAAPGNSFHNYGLALDVSITPENWTLFGQIAEAIGFRWGGRFSTPEPWHIDAGNVLTIAEARSWFDQGQYLVGV